MTAVKQSSLVHHIAEKYFEDIWFQKSISTLDTAHSYSVPNMSSTPLSAFSYVR